MRPLILITAILGTFAVAFALTPAVSALARRLKIYDLPGERKVHTVETPRLGGIAVFIALSLALAATAIPGVASRLILGVRVEYIRILFEGALAFFLLGLIDDFRPLPAQLKLVIQFAIALVVASYGYRIEALLGTVHLPMPVAVGLTAFWIVGIVNTINFIDGLDGLAAGVSLISSIAFFTLALIRGDSLSGFIAAVTIGSLLGFLPFNFHPARVFLGDSGSYTLGFFLASTSILGLFKQITLLTIFLPVLILAFPIADTAFAIIRRMRRGIPVTRPDKRHIHHRVLFLLMRRYRRTIGNGNGMNLDALAHRNAVLWLYGVGFAFAALAVLLGIKG
jgi:UDP-GlcNAc:undecaprenyl-phosphate GlcNAc-1-phosphate transferase